MTRTSTALVLAAIAALSCACSKTPPPPPAPPPPPLPAAQRLASDAETTQEAIRFLEDKAKADKLDIVARNQLVGYYLNLLRQSGNIQYLELAAKAAKESLEAVPAERNAGGQNAQALVDYASHDFTSALDRATALSKADPDELQPYLIMMDSLLELGEYKRAAELLPEITKRGSTSAPGALNLHTRLARIAQLRGRPADAAAQYSEAVQAALAINPPPQESVAWCYWQLGETAFYGGKYDDAEARYRDALTTFPDYYRALASLGRVLAAKGDLPGAIAQYERVVKIVPDPAFVAALGDLYTLSGRTADAETQYKLVEQIGRLSALNGVIYNRQLVLFWADHERNAAQAFELAKKEYEVRKDVYGADAVAWAALKAGKLDEAKAAIADALVLDTVDPRLFYHAGMIAKATGDAAGAKSFLEKALETSPQFDPMQAKLAREALGRA